VAGPTGFQYTDKFGEGNYHCRGCGAGGGLKLLQGYHGWDFGTTFKRVEECVGSVTARPRPRPSEPSAERMKKLAKRLWEEAKPITVGDEVDRYLRNRGLQLLDYPKTLRCHPALGYYEKDASGRSKKVCAYPAMRARIQKADGHAVTRQRTYLQDGKKRWVANRRRSSPPASTALRSASSSHAIAWQLPRALRPRWRSTSSTAQPVWAALSAGNMEKLWVPDTVHRISIYADNDANSEYKGQSSAFILAGRLKKKARKSGRVGQSSSRRSRCGLGGYLAQPGSTKGRRAA
jgi:putative DNA primase/helicase